MDIATTSGGIIMVLRILVMGLLSLWKSFDKPVCEDDGVAVADPLSGVLSFLKMFRIECSFVMVVAILYGFYNKEK